MRKSIFVTLAILGFASAQNVGEKAPNFTLLSNSGEVVELADFKGQPVLVNFWNTWCPDCNRELPVMDQFYRDNPGKFAFLAIAKEEQPAHVVNYVQEKGWSFTVLTDPKTDSATENTKDIVKRYRVIGQPWSFFIDGEGVIQAVHRGALSEEQLAAYMADIGVN
jgi:thiol-disulfide isomerase/thioredoxin